MLDTHRFTVNAEGHPEPVLDSAALDALRELGQDGGQQGLAKFVQLYLAEVPSLLRDLRDGLEQTDAGAIQNAAHTLKSNSAYVGAIHVRRLSERLERLAHRGDIAQAGELITPLEQAYARAAQALVQELSAPH